MSPSGTVTTPFDSLPCVVDTNVMPAGSVTVSVTLCAASGPALLAITVNVTLSPCTTEPALEPIETPILAVGTCG